MEYDQTTLWLSAMTGDGPEFERLRTAYRLMRERAAKIAASIQDDLREFTVHDVTHLDALWETSSLVAGVDFNLNPLEGFVFGAACLVHDIGMGLASYPMGREAIFGDKFWEDTLGAHLSRSLGRKPTKVEFSSAPESVIKQAIGDILRIRHAETAATLCETKWTVGSEDYFLIEDQGLRQAYGRLIGSIGASHHWDLSRVEMEFRQPMGPAVGFPQSWTIDSLKLACLVRVADAAQLDNRRAPGFLLALRRLQGVSLQHWQFQTRMTQPQVDGDRLVFTSTPFPRSEAQAWWVCYEALQMVDKELRESDQLLATSGRPRFVVSGVAFVESPLRMKRTIPVSGWEPVDASVRITNVDGLVRMLGGSQLYGDSSFGVPLRELIQNASDAVRARRVYEKRPEEWGQIVVRFTRQESGDVLSIEDSGTGMSQAVMTGPLLDFGESYWMSALSRSELPGLQMSSFSAGGRFGIGFFSVFMLGKQVSVISRRFSDRPSETRVLEFEDGTAARPLLRDADANEFLPEPGTKIVLQLETRLEPGGSLLRRRRFAAGIEPYLVWAIEDMSPALGVDLSLVTDGGPPRLVIQASDWLELGPKELLRRVGHRSPYSEQLLRPLIDDSGRVVGRLAMAPGKNGVIVSEGLKTGLARNVEGLVSGQPARASRDEGTVDISLDAIKSWAEEQLTLIANYVAKNDQVEFAALIQRCGISPIPLAIAWISEGWVTFDEIRAWASQKRKITLVELDRIEAYFSFGSVGQDRSVGVSDLKEIDFGSDTIVAFSDHYYSPAMFRIDGIDSYEIETDFFTKGSSSVSFADLVKEAIALEWQRTEHSLEIEDQDDYEVEWDRASVSGTVEQITRTSRQSSLKSD